MSKKRKILVCGDVKGKLDVLLQRYATCLRVGGEFDAVFCVGDFFGDCNGDRLLMAYKNGLNKISIPTYILGPMTSEQYDWLSQYNENNNELCPNLFYLGNSGVFTMASGLKVAYVSGRAMEPVGDSIEKCTSTKVNEFGAFECKKLLESCTLGRAEPLALDLLLTNQWPMDLEKYCTSYNSQPMHASDLVAWLVLQLKPRYHFCGSENNSFVRPPIRWPTLVAQTHNPPVPTRIICLADVGNTTGNRWNYALELEPFTTIDRNVLLKATTDETNCPFNEDRLTKMMRHLIPKRSNDATNGYKRFSDFTPQDESRGGGSSQRKKTKIVVDKSECWFCLSSKNVQKDLIIDCGENVYIAKAKGGLHKDHMLICPVQHAQNTVNLPAKTLAEIDVFKRHLNAYFKQSKRVAVYFERNYKSVHAQIDVVPIPTNEVEDVKTNFDRLAAQYELNWTELKSGTQLQEHEWSSESYFVMEFPGGLKYLLSINSEQSFPINFGRHVVADVLNATDKIDWRNCTQFFALEVEQALDFRNRFSKFRNTQD